MSTTSEKLDTIEHSVNVAKKHAEKLRLLKEVSYLDKRDQYLLDQHEHVIKMGEKILKENGRLK